MKPEIVENRGQQIFLLAWMSVILAASLFLRDPVIYLQAFDVFGELLLLGNSPREKGKIDPAGLPDLEIGLLAARDRLDIPGMVQDIFIYDRSVKKIRPVARPVEPVVPTPPRRIEPKPGIDAPRTNPAVERRRRCLERLDDAWGRLIPVGTIERNGRLCGMFKFQGATGVMAERIITMEPGDEVWPDSGVTLSETGLMPASRVIFVVLSTRDGDEEFTKVYNKGD